LEFSRAWKSVRWTLPTAERFDGELGALHQDIGMFDRKHDELPTLIAFAFR
jgi:hypothetical protein